MRPPTPRLRALAAAVYLTLATALLPAPSPARAADPGPVPSGLVLHPPTKAGGPMPLGPTVAAPAAPATVPGGFRDELVIGNLDSPTVVQFAADGRIIVGEKRGRIQIFSSATDTSPGVYTGLETQVHNLWDRGFLGMVIDPAFTTGRPYLYVAYTANDIIGDGLGAPKWPSDPAAPWNDRCDDPPGVTTDGCVVSGRVSRLTVSGKTISGPETVLIQDWCQQFPSHSMGTLAFGPEGALYVSAGEGASFDDVDWGQLGGTRPNKTNPVTKVNPCGDPPGNAPGTANTLAKTAEGGSLRAQDIRTCCSLSDPTGLSGALIRINPDTGAAWRTNANVASTDAKARMIVAYGFRNPFRFAIRPGTGEVWIGDVGNMAWEEINEVGDPAAAVKNFGWPCYEGAATNGAWDAVDADMCESLYATAGAVTDPSFAYGHDDPITVGEQCDMTRGSALAGIAFLGPTNSYPSQYAKALFITDYNRRCIWWIPANSTTGRPNFSGRQLFANLTRPAPSTDTPGGAVYLGTDGSGDLVYSDFDRGEIRRIKWYGANVPPSASFTATPSSGTLPLTVAFDASGTTDPNPGDPLNYAWDLDGDLAYDDAVGRTTSRTYNAKAQIAIGLKVTDGQGATDTTTRTIWPGYATPSATIDTPTAAFQWAVGETIAFSGTARDGQGATLPASSMSWAVNIEHCPSSCHSHPPFYTFTGAAGSFPAPDHGYPSHLRLTLIVTDGPISTTVTRDINPKTGIVQARSDPPGLPLSLAGQTGAPPPDATAIVGSTVTVSAPTTGTIGGTTYTFAGWSDGGSAVHNVAATQATTTLIAFYSGPPPPPPPPPPVTSTVFRPVDPARLLDSRVGNGLSGVFKSQIARTFQVTGRGGIPADAVAVTGNLTITGQTGGGYLAMTPTPTNSPSASNLNFPVGVNRASLVTATLGPGGTVSVVYVSTAGRTAHVVFDVTGYFTASGTNGTYRPIDPVRLLDSRSGNGISGPFVVGARRRWDVAGRGGIPANATAVTANLTVVNPTAAGYVALYPAGAPKTTISTLNFRAGETAANGVVIRLGTAGRLSALVSGPARARVHVILDVTGYFVDDAAGARYFPLTPGRLLDSRTGVGLAGPFAANTGRTLPVAGSLVPSDAVAINGTLTTTAATAPGYLALMPTAANTSATSTLNFRAREDRANGVFTRLSGGSVGILYAGPAGTTSHVVFDVAGYFR